MKKKLWIVLAAAVMVLALGTGVYAAADNGGFEKMLPFMKQMHPDFSDEQLQNMYKSCHGDGNTPGMMGSSSGMMGNASSIVQ